MRLLRSVFVALAAVFLIGALISYVGLFDQVENTTTLLAGAHLSSLAVESGQPLWVQSLCQGVPLVGVVLALQYLRH